MPLTVSGLSAEDIIETTKSDKKWIPERSVLFCWKRWKAYLDRTVTDEEMNADSHAFWHKGDYMKQKSKTCITGLIIGFWRRSDWTSGRSCWRSII